MLSKNQRTITHQLKILKFLHACKVAEYTVVMNSMVVVGRSSSIYFVGKRTTMQFGCFYLELHFMSYGFPCDSLSYIEKQTEICKSRDYSYFISCTYDLMQIY